MEMYKCDEGNFVLAEADEIIAASRNVIEQRYRPGTALDDPKMVKDLCFSKLADKDHEVFCVILLDRHCRLIKFIELFRGNALSVTVHPREVVKCALAYNATACVLAHCHPRSDAIPSNADIEITKQLKTILRIVDVIVADHVIVSSADTYSMSENNDL